MEADIEYIVKTSLTDGHEADKSKTVGPGHDERTVILESVFLSKDSKGEDLDYVDTGKHEVVEVDVSYHVSRR